MEYQEIECGLLGRTPSGLDIKEDAGVRFRGEVNSSCSFLLHRPS